MFLTTADSLFGLDSRSFVHVFCVIFLSGLRKFLSKLSLSLHAKHNFATHMKNMTTHFTINLGKKQLDTSFSPIAFGRWGNTHPVYKYVSVVFSKQGRVNLCKWQCSVYTSDPGNVSQNNLLSFLVTLLFAELYYRHAICTRLPSHGQIFKNM